MSCCAICLGDFGEERLSKCSGNSHVFHEDCLRKWARVKATCPICCVELEGEFKRVKKQVEIDEVALNLKALDFFLASWEPLKDFEEAKEQMRILRTARERCALRLIEMTRS